MADPDRRSPPKPGENLPDAERLVGGELNAAITTAVIRIHAKHLGRGPKRASTFYHGNVLVTLMHDVLTPAERTLARTHHHEAISRIRQLFQETMEADLCAAVERLTGRHVVAFLSGNHIDPDISAEVFVLDATL